MEREHGYLDRESQEDQQEGEQLRAHYDAGQGYLHISREQVLRQVDHIRRLAAQSEVEQQDADQHKYTTEEGVQQELPGRVDTSRHTMLDGFVAPDTDQQEHRGQLNLPEEEEEQQVNGHKHAHDARFQQQ